MKLKHLPSEFQKALPVLEKLKKAGFEAYFVGGSVRDALLNRPIHDVDIATSAYPEEVKEIFARTVDIGIEHGTVLVLTNDGDYEVTTFRTEDVYVDYRRPRSVSFVRSLEEDLKRRDFTVNAFALDDQGQVIDLFDGWQDLQQGVLRAVGKAQERFSEDALRILRGLRFAACLDFSIEKNTFDAMTSHAPLLANISVERSFVEIDKLLMAPCWRQGLNYLLSCRAYAYLPKLSGQQIALERLSSNLAKDYHFINSEQAWAALLIYLGVKDVTTFLKAWKTSLAFQRTVAQLVEIYHLRQEESLTPLTVYTYGRELLELAEKLRQAAGLATDFALIRRLDQELLIHDKHEIVIKGGDLITEFNLKPGKALGEHLKQIELAIVNGKLVNERAAILTFVQELEGRLK